MKAAVLGAAALAALWYGELLTGAPLDPQAPVGQSGTAAGYSAIARLPSINQSPPTLALQPTPEPIPRGQENQEPGITLDEISQVALAQSPRIREAETQAAAARGHALQAGLYPNPTLGQGSPQMAGNQSQYNAFVMQDVVTKGKIQLNAAAAQRAAEEAELAWVRARFNVLTTIRQRFYSALAAQQRVEVLEGMVNIARSATQVGKQLLKNDLGTQGDVLLLEIELSKAEAELTNAVTLSETSKRQLAVATGLIDMPIVRVRGDLRQPLPDYELIAVQQGVISRNALARSAQIEITRSQLVLRRQEVQPFPNLSLMGGYQNQLPGANAPQNQAMYQVEMVVPLFDRNQGNIRAAQAGVGTAMAQLNRVQTELVEATVAALGRYLTARQLADRYAQEILPGATRVQSIFARLYGEGHIDFLRYLAAQRALLDANLSYVNSQEARWTAAAEIAGLLQSEQFP